MLRDGKYAAWFRTSRGQGTGIVHLVDGRISGCDSFFTYGGSYQIEDDRFTAVLTIHRHTEGPPSVFGLDEVEVSLTGVCSGAITTCSGTAAAAPDAPFEATLIFSQEEAPPPEGRGEVVKLKADRLPKGLDSRHDSRSRPRHLLSPGPSKTSLS
jgi:hypothetical protein